MKKEKNQNQPVMDSFESFAWLIYKEVEKYINENPQEFQEAKQDKEREEKAA